METENVEFVALIHYLVDSTFPFLKMCDFALIALAFKSGLAGDGSVGDRGGSEGGLDPPAARSPLPTPGPSTSTVTVQSTVSSGN